MKAMVCEMCGSHDLIKQNGVYICQNCGTKYDIEEAKKLIVEVSGSIKIDNSEKIENYYQLARRAKANGNKIEAAKYYDLIRQDNPNDWEASFFASFYAAMQSNIAGIENAAYTITRSALSSLKLANDNTVDKNERALACSAISSAVMEAGITLYTNAVSHSEEFPSANGIDGKRFVRTKAVCDMFIDVGDAIEATLLNDPEHVSNYCCPLWKMVFNICHKEGIFPQKLIAKGSNHYLEKIQKCDPDFKVQDNWRDEYLNRNTNTNTNKSVGCYIATSLYGSYDCPEVWILRRYRDYTLAETWYGRVFIRTYYAISPTLVRWFGNTNWFKSLFKPRLDKMVCYLRKKGLSDKPYSDRIW